MKTTFRRAFLLALLPALAACGHTTATVPVKTKAKPHAVASVNIVKMPVAEGTASVATGATPKALPTGAPPSATPSAAAAVKGGPVKVSVAGYVFNESGSLVTYHASMSSMASFFRSERFESRRVIFSFNNSMARGAC